MNCVVCKKGTTKPGKTTITFEKDGATLVFKSVPAHMCNVCGEAYVNEDITDDF
jgi:YgiT-type zinc finger domain-containing protein